MELTHIHSNSAKQAHTELLQALGSENNPAQWIDFMRTVFKYFPFLMRDSGAPTNQQIENSAIGQLGFKSWSAMIKAPREEGGLNWSWNNWKQWKKAFKVVNQHEYLCDMNITASAVMRLASDFKDVEFPTSLEELEQAKSAIAQKKKVDEAEKVSSLKARVQELEQKLIAANAKIEAHDASKQDLATIVDSVAQLKAENAALSTKCEELQSRNNELEHDARVSKSRYVDLKKRLSSMSLWQRIKADFNI